MNTRRLALWLLGPLTLLALLLSMQLYVVYRTEGLPMSFSGLLLLQVGHWYLWAIAGPVAWTAANRLPLRGSHKIRNIARHVGIAVAVSLTVVGLYVALTYAVVRLPLTRGWFLEMDRSRPLAALAAFFFFAYFHIELMAYAVIFAIAHAVRSGGELRAREREALELSSQLATARLQVLTAQLQPHFLFNTLHTIGSLILQRKNDEAVRILAELGELLRMTLHRQTAESIPLSLEIEHLMRYLRIEEARFGDRLDVRWEVDDASLGALVPPLILQPLVENALKHGVSARIEPATLVIRAATVEGRLRISVRNDGPTLPEGWEIDSSAGFGLRNVRERLRTIGAACRLTVENAGADGVLATIDLPALTARQPEGAHA